MRVENEQTNVLPIEFTCTSHNSVLKSHKWNFFSPNHLVCFMSSEVFIVVDLFCISSIEMSNKSSKKELLKKIHAKEIVKRFVLTGYHCYLYIQLLLLLDLPSMSTVGLKIISIVYVWFGCDAVYFNLDYP